MSSVAQSGRIFTRCPACRNDTLVIHHGRLLCTWHACPNPVLIDQIGEVRDVGLLNAVVAIVGWAMKKQAASDLKTDSSEPTTTKGQ